MTIEEMYDWFNLMQDKVDSIYYESFEVDQFINRSIQDFINKVIHKFVQDPNGQLMIDSAIEENMNVSEVLRPLRILDMSLPLTSGTLEYTTIETELETRTDDPDPSVLYMLALVAPNGKPVRFIRENDFATFAQNSFKEATSDYPQFRVGDQGYIVTPSEAGNYNVSVIKSPTEVCYEDGVSTDLPETTHDFIMAKALQLAGIASKDADLIQVNNAIGK